MHFWTGALACVALACGSAIAAEPVITTVAGGGSIQGDGGQATDAIVGGPLDVAVDAAGNLYIAEVTAIRKVAPDGTISTIGGNGNCIEAAPADGELATTGSICPRMVAVDGSGYVYFNSYQALRKISPDGIVTTVGHPELDEGLGVVDMARDPNGNLYAAANYRVFKLASDGTVTHIAGNGDYATTGDGGPALYAGMNPSDVAADGAGNVYIVDGDYVRKIAPDGTITRLFGGIFRSDPLAAVTNTFYPSGVDVDADGNVYVSHRQNFISMISPQGMRTVVAGQFHDSDSSPYGAWWGFGGDGGPASEAVFYEPSAIATDADGNLYIADERNNRIRKIIGRFPVIRFPAGVRAFDPAPAYYVPSSVYAEGVAAGDIDGDGRTDAIISTSVKKLGVYRQLRGGGFALPVQWTVPNTAIMGGIVSGDLNRDGFDDIVLTDETGLQVLLSGPGGALVRTSYAGPGTTPRAYRARLADMDGNGYPDVVVMATSNYVGKYGLVVFYNNRRGAFPTHRYLLDTTGGGPYIEDLDRDGRPDILMLTGKGIAVYRNDGAGGVLPPYAIQKADLDGYFNRGIAVGDFDSDGLREIILASDGSPLQSQLAHFEETDNGDFAFVRTIPVYDAPGELVARDMNKDGHDDLLIQHLGRSAIGYMQQTEFTDGSRGLDVELKTFLRTDYMQVSYSLIVADMNGDGCDDILDGDMQYGIQVLAQRNCTVRDKVGSAPRRIPNLQGGGTSMPSLAFAGATQLGEEDHQVWLASQSLGRMTWTQRADSAARSLHVLAAAPLPVMMMSFWSAFAAWWNA